MNALSPGTAAELAEETFADLSVVLAENPRPVRWPYSGAGIPDEAFLRDKVPMTKEEVRPLTISKLRLCPHHVLWDVGAGRARCRWKGPLRSPPDVCLPSNGSRRRWSSSQKQGALRRDQPDGGARSGA